MKNVVIYDAGLYGQEVCANFFSIFPENEYKNIGFLAGFPGEEGTEVCGKPILSLRDVKAIENLIVLITVFSKSVRKELEQLVEREEVTCSITTLEELFPEEKITERLVIGSKAVQEMISIEFFLKHYNYLWLRAMIEKGKNTNAEDAVLITGSSCS